MWQKPFESALFLELLLIAVQSKAHSWTAYSLKMGPIGSPVTSVLSPLTPRNNPKTEEFLSTTVEAVDRAKLELFLRGSKIQKIQNPECVSCAVEAVTTQ